MEKQVARKRMAAIILLTISSISLCVQAGASYFSFESTYPETSYKKAFDASVGVLGYVHMMQDEHLMAEHAAALVHDALIGRISRACAYTQTLADECSKGLPLLTDDLVFLIDIFYQIENSCRSMVSQADCADLDLHAVHRIRDQLIALIPSF